MKKFLITCLLTGLCVTGCGAVSKNEQQTNQVASPSQKALASPTATELTKSNTTAKYTTTYKGNVTVDGEKCALQIKQNTKDITDTKMSIAGEQVTLQRVSIGTGYAHPKVSMADVTGDGKKELVMFLGGGASGGLSDIQIFGKRDGVWMEIPTPDALWEDNNISLSYNAEKIEIKVLENDKTYTIDYKGKEDEVPFVGIRTCKQKGDTILIQNDVDWNVSGNKIGLITQKLQYDKKSNSFVNHSIQVAGISHATSR